MDVVVVAGGEIDRAFGLREQVHGAGKKSGRGGGRIEQITRDQDGLRPLASGHPDGVRERVELFFTGRFGLVRREHIKARAEVQVGQVQELQHNRKNLLEISVLLYGLSREM